MALHWDWSCQHHLIYKLSTPRGALGSRQLDQNWKQSTVCMGRYPPWTGQDTQMEQNCSCLTNTQWCPCSAHSPDPLRFSGLFCERYSPNARAALQNEKNRTGTGISMFGRFRYIITRASTTPHFPKDSFPSLSPPRSPPRFPNTLMEWSISYRRVSQKGLWDFPNYRYSGL